MDINSVLASLSGTYANSTLSTSTSNSSTINASTSSTDFSNMTISQIRDMTDKLALSGKLSTEQQLELIGYGLEDCNPADTSYQPANDGIGYSRSDTGTYNIVSMINGAADFAASMQNSQEAANFKGIATAIENLEDTATNGGGSVNTTVY